MARSVLAADITLPETLPETLTELLHHPCMFMAFGLIRILPILSQEKVCCCKRCPLVSINERMVAGNAFGITGRELIRCHLRRRHEGSEGGPMQIPKERGHANHARRRLY